MPGDSQGEYYPLIRSLRSDGKDTTPQLYVVKNGKPLGIMGSNAARFRKTLQSKNIRLAPGAGMAAISG